jgi:hypothetical protein
VAVTGRLSRAREIVAPSERLAFRTKIGGWLRQKPLYEWRVFRPEQGATFQQINEMATSRQTGLPRSAWRRLPMVGDSRLYIHLGYDPLFRVRKGMQDRFMRKVSPTSKP